MRLRWIATNAVNELAGSLRQELVDCS